MTAKLIRFAYLADRTIGRLYYEDLALWTVERPWKSNEPFVSCIPESIYHLQRVDSPRFGPNMWQVANVPHRTHILIHAANRAEQLAGCIAPGMGLIKGLGGVTDSRAAIGEFYGRTAELEELNFTIVSGSIHEI